MLLTPRTYQSSSKRKSPPPLLALSSLVFKIFEFKKLLGKIFVVLKRKIFLFGLRHCMPGGGGYHPENKFLKSKI